mgnify:CR=1 FL=1
MATLPRRARIGPRLRVEALALMFAQDHHERQRHARRRRAANHLRQDIEQSGNELQPLLQAGCKLHQVALALARRVPRRDDRAPGPSGAATTAARASS